MKFYTKQHDFYCGVDLHANARYVCILDASGETVVHKNVPTRPKAFLRLIKPYRKGLIVGCECMFTWYWLADLCADEEIDFVLGHALFMRAIHGGKAKNHKIDSHKRSSFSESESMLLLCNCSFLFAQVSPGNTFYHFFG